MTHVSAPSWKARQPLPRSTWVLAIILVVGWIFLPGFSSIDNATNVLRVAAILALATYGQTIVLISGGIEFSIGSSVALCSVTSVLALQYWPIGPAFLVGFVTILAVGIINGLLISYLRLSAFLVTLGMLLLVHGLAAIVVGGLPVEAPDREGIHALSGGAVLGIPVPVLLAAAGAILLHLLLERTILGRSWFLIGSSAPAAEMTGIKVGRIVFLAYFVAACFVGLAGLILTSRVAAGEPNLYPTLPFESMAACAIGGIPLSGGRGSALNAVIGVLVIAVLNNAIVLLNYPAYTQLALLGVIMIGAVMAQGFPALKSLSWSRSR
jgi:ribose/xylose/arabinose/galactoside ABC-type transport system permease subunit